MNKLSVLLLTCLLTFGTANAARVETRDVSIDASGAVNVVHDIRNDEGNLTALSELPLTSQLTKQTDAVPPTFGIVGLGLCLVLLGYMMKNKAE